MFSLIITIISIALVAALALATIYYGGSAFSRGNDGATAARLINEGQQVNGAVTMYLADVAGNSAAALGSDNGTAGVQIAELSPSYLSQVPSSFASVAATTNAVAGGSISLAAQPAGVCTEVNKRAGLTPTATTTVANAPTLYGCLSDNTFFYKF